MLCQREILLLSCSVILAASTAVKDPSKLPASYASNQVYSSLIGALPISGIDTMSIPYIPKPTFFPKLVDPKTMISKKTDLLYNLFGGLGPVAYTSNLKSSIPYASTGSLPPNSEDNIEDTFNKYKRGILELSSPKFNPFSSKSGPVSPLTDDKIMSNFIDKEEMSDKRSLDSGLDDTKPDTDLIRTLGPPPSYPTLTPISEEPELEDKELFQKVDTPKEYLPGMFSPFEPAIDPSVFTSKKFAFLDTLFKNIATSTTADTTDAPVPKTTIVPPSFWIPSSVIPSPTEYNDKVSAFLDRLFENLKLNKTEDGTDVNTDTTRITRSMQDISSITAAKDTITDTILSELSNLKDDMVTTLNDLVAYQKAVAIPKKPFKPFAPNIWSKPVIDSMLPFEQRMAVLNQVFDMLSDLQKNISISVQEAIKTNEVSSDDSESIKDISNIPLPFNKIPYVKPDLPVNETLLNVIKKRLSILNNLATTYPTNSVNDGIKTTRTLPGSTKSFWVAYPKNTSLFTKRQTDENPYFTNEEKEFNRHLHQQSTRAVKMQMHQGYQSLPAGAIESVQAGGGSTQSHQGGGIKLLGTNDYGSFDKWTDRMQHYINGERHGHHHNHH